MGAGRRGTDRGRVRRLAALRENHRAAAEAQRIGPSATIDQTLAGLESLNLDAAIPAIVRDLRTTQRDLMATRSAVSTATADEYIWTVLTLSHALIPTLVPPPPEPSGPDTTDGAPDEETAPITDTT